MGVQVEKRFQRTDAPAFRDGPLYELLGQQHAKLEVLFERRTDDRALLEGFMVEDDHRPLGAPSWLACVEAQPTDVIMIATAHWKEPLLRRVLPSLLPCGEILF